MDNLQSDSMPGVDPARELLQSYRDFAEQGAKSCANPVETALCRALLSIVQKIEKGAEHTGNSSNWQDAYADIGELISYLPPLRSYKTQVGGALRGVFGPVIPQGSLKTMREVAGIGREAHRPITARRRAVLALEIRMKNPKISWANLPKRLPGCEGLTPGAIRQAVIRLKRLLKKCGVYPSCL